MTKQKDRDELILLMIEAQKTGEPFLVSFPTEEQAKEAFEEVKRMWEAKDD